MALKENTAALRAILEALQKLQNGGKSPESEQ